MRLGLNVGYWGLGLTPDQQLDLVKEAEAAGFHSVWAARPTARTPPHARLDRGPDGKIRIGSAIFQIRRARPP